jgi:hypothetical protein
MKRIAFYTVLVMDFAARSCRKIHMSRGSYFFPLRKGAARTTASVRRVISMLPLVVMLLGGILTACGSFVLNPTSLTTVPIKFDPAPPEGISFDDMVYDSGLGKLIVPLDGTGYLALLDPKTLAVKYISGFSKVDPTTNGQGGSTSAAVAHGLIYALDNSALKIMVVDPNQGTILGSTPVASFPDYIRYVAPTNELWVTELDPEQIEVFSIPTSGNPIPVLSGTISVPNGPHALVIDNNHGLAYTNQPPSGLTAVIQVQTHDIIAEWGNGCTAARGMALDIEQGWLFVACREGKVNMLDTNNDGMQITSVTYGSGLDFVGYNAKLHHVYLASGNSNVLGIFGITIGPRPTTTPDLHMPPTPTPPPGPTPTVTIQTVLLRLATADTGFKDKCVVNDDLGDVWVCDSDRSQLLMVKDIFPDTANEWQQNP